MVIGSSWDRTYDVYTGGPWLLLGSESVLCPPQYSVYPIIWAAGRGHGEIVHLLLQHGAKVNCSDKVPHSTPL